MKFSRKRYIYISFKNYKILFVKRRNKTYILYNLKSLSKYFFLNYKKYTQLN